jgi:hypothetical protein
MRNPNGQKYCVNCEMWHFEHERPKKQKFGEITKFQGKTQTTHNELQKVLPKKEFQHYNINQTILQSLQVKLAYLSNELNNETDVGKTKDILECIKMCLENINTLKTLSNN